jgi:hypothetical protein
VPEKKAAVRAAAFSLADLLFVELWFDSELSRFELLVRVCLL